MEKRRGPLICYLQVPAYNEYPTLYLMTCTGSHWKPRAFSTLLVVLFLLLLLFTRPLPRNESMAEYHGAPEAGKLPRVWTRGRKEIESRQRVSGAKSP